ncbi:fused MFS/spermidine synthase [Salsipaludibacter albus]|uniref:fused MFS/spermidine synthase n=1 Tax=Salsipaludibacter albus TaxID=2849650 RepID=UPI001EE4777B|nr:fused MFS/spermidine synthase [Salsipaludibacter albus]MBY5160877.1 fused MFS/spermidine synthase [Salsipaludibacter albus]
MPAFLAALLVFVSSGAVLVLETLAGRLMAPYVGVTLESFTGIIGTILAGIAAGSWLGGRLADRYDPRVMLGPTMVLGGALGLLSIPVIDYLGSSMQGATPSVIVILTFAGFFIPSAILSAVTPMVVKLQLSDLADTGRVVGWLSAVGTVGALMGTFTTGFILVAAWPTRPIIRWLGGLLVLGGLVLWVWLRRDADPDGDLTRPTAGMLVVLVAAGALSFAAAHPCEQESAYFCARVEVDPERSTGRVLWLDTLRHSYVDVEDPTHLEFTYAQTMSDVLATIAPEGEALDVTHVGGAGMSLPRYLRETRPGTQSTVLELDPLMTEIAVEELAWEPGPDVEVLHGDARLRLDEVPEGSQDLVIGDAFGGVSVPWHLATEEFVTAIHDVLRPGGVYALNMIDYQPLGFARAELATLAAVFDHVAVLAPPERLTGESGGNFILVGSDEPLPVTEMLARNTSRGDDEQALWTEGSTVDGVTLEDFVGDARVLTDDFAPVDQLLTPYPTR